jgi:hypothetical protein
MIASVSFAVSGFRTLMACALVGLCLTACGGGGGDDTSLSVSETSVTLEPFVDDTSGVSKSVQVTWSGKKVAGYIVGTLPGQNLPSWLSVSASGNASPATVSFSYNGFTRVTSRQTTTIRIVTGDSDANVLDIADVAVTLDPVPLPRVAGAPVQLSWVESEQLAPRQLAITRDPRVRIVEVKTDAPWMSAVQSADTLTISGNAATLALQVRSFDPIAGRPLNDNILLVYEYGGRQRNLVVPVDATVRRALSSTTPVSIELNASSTPADLTRFRATVATATQAPVSLSVQSDVPWLAATASATGSPNNIALTLVPSQLAPLAVGTHVANLTVTGTNATVVALQIPVTLNMRVPEAYMASPVLYVGGSPTDYVVVHGGGFTDAAAELRRDGGTAGAATIVSDTQLRVVPGVLPAGTYTLSVANRLGITRRSAALRVVDPPAYSNFSMPASIGLPPRIIASPANNAVFAANCYFCNNSSLGTLSTVQRFSFDASTNQWAATLHSFPNLVDISMSPDETQLLVLTSNTLRVVDPVTMATTKSVLLPPWGVGTAYQLGVANDGLVLIRGLGQAYSLITDTFVALPGMSDSTQGVAIVASADGSRVLFGGSRGTQDNFRYYDSALGRIVVSTGANQFDSPGTISRYAERFYNVDTLFDRNLAPLATLPLGLGVISADGSRVFGIEGGANYRLRTFDVTNAASITELASIALSRPEEASRLVADPRGGVVFRLTERTFNVHVVP